MHPGLIGGLAGGILGLAGGVVGTRAAIRNTSGPRERAFIVKASFIGWTAGLIFLALLILFSSPWRFLIWVPYSILLPLGIISCNRTLQRIRQEEAHTPPGTWPDEGGSADQ